MKSYEIFEATAREDNLIASVIYLQENHNGNTEDYKDYLLARSNFLFDHVVTEPVRIVNVPYDKQIFENWLEKNPYWKDNPCEAKSAWALDIVKNKEILSSLYSKYPVLPGTPENEEITTNIFYSVIPLAVEKREDISLYSKQLPYEKLEKILLAFKNFLFQVPTFERLSLIRCRGAHLMIGDRLITPVNIEEAEHYLRTTIQSTTDFSEKIIPIPRSMRIRASSFNDCLEYDPFLTIVLLPIIITGSADEVHFCKNMLQTRSAQEDIDEISNEMLSLINGFEKTNIKGKVIIAEEYEVVQVINEMFKNDYENDYEDDYNNNNEDKLIKNKKN